METAVQSATDRRADELADLTDALLDVRGEVLIADKRFAIVREAVHEKHRDSASNFLRYLAMRQRDIRPMQERLAAFGLSSLGRSESHVLANLDAVLKILCELTQRERLLAPPGKVIDYPTGRSLLEQNTTATLGPKPAGRDVRIMVTMPSEAATDYSLVRDLLRAGMDCMRINCAHDHGDAWASMVENLRRAKLELGKDCRVLMDLPGPKLRTGPVEALPGVIKWQPRRNRYGRVIAPARIWLTSKEDPSSPPFKADACLALVADWIAKLAPGEIVKFFDARGQARFLEIKERTHDGCRAEAIQTAYLSEGTVFQVRRDSNGNFLSPDTARIDNLQAEPQAILLKPGDTLVLTKSREAGRPAAHDADGGVVAPGTIGVSLPEIFDDVRAGDSIWFDDGKVGGMIRSLTGDAITVEITKARPNGTKLGADKGINLPDSNLRLPALTKEDIELLPFIVRHADLVGYSFVRSEDDVAQLQANLQLIGGDHLGIVLKIETRRAFERLPRLILAAMRGPVAGIMIARGDLAVECGYERTGELQEEIMWLAEAAHMPVIWATQVLENLAKTGQPSRAEITDAAMAERAECVMLNKGTYVVQAVQVLDDVLRRMQGHQNKKISLLRPLHLAREFCREL